MKALRVLLRLTALSLHTAMMFVVLWIGMPLVGLGGPPSGRPRARGHWRARAMRLWSRGSLRILGVRVRDEGDAPEPPFFLVCNHLSYLDVLVLSSRLSCSFVAKSDVAGWPIVGALCRSVETVFIDRTRKRDIPRVMRQVETILAEDRGVVIFPEGTSSKGEQVLPFRPSLLEIAVRAGRPVCYASLSYRTPAEAPPAHLSVCWWGEMTFGGHVVGLLGLPAVEATLTFGAEPVQEDDRKRMAERLRGLVERLFRPVI